MDPIVFVLVLVSVSMLPYIWLYAVMCLVWWWGRPPLTCQTESVGVAPRCVYGFRRIVSALRRMAAKLWRCFMREAVGEREF